MLSSLFPSRSLFPWNWKALIDGKQTICTRLGGDTIVDGGSKQLSIEGILLVRRVAAVILVAE